MLCGVDGAEEPVGAGAGGLLEDDIEAGVEAITGLQGIGSVIHGDAGAAVGVEDVDVRVSDFFDGDFAEGLQAEGDILYDCAGGIFSGIGAVIALVVGEGFHGFPNGFGGVIEGADAVGVSGEVFFFFVEEALVILSESAGGGGNVPVCLRDVVEAFLKFGDGGSAAIAGGGEKGNQEKGDVSRSLHSIRKLAWGAGFDKWAMKAKYVRGFAESGRGFWGFGGVFVGGSGWLVAPAFWRMRLRCRPEF